VAALETGQRQGRVPVSLDLSVDVTTHVKQELHRSGVTVHGRQHERGDAEF